jgi:ABC-type uncharacterized transport system ATPase component
MQKAPRYITLIGEVGAGKSTLVNILTGNNEAPAGDDPDGVTKAITFYSGKINDTPV